MRYTGRRRGRASREVGNNNHWISFSDLMSALLLVIVLIMFYSIYQYVDMLELATADLLEQQGLLEAKEQELKENQDKLTESEELQVTQAAKLLLQQQQLEEAQALLAQQREELSQIQTQVSEQQIQGIWKGGRVEGMGDVILFMQSTIGMILFIICPLLLFFLWDIWRRHRMDKAEIARTAELEAELAALKSGREENDHRADTKEP